MNPDDILAPVIKRTTIPEEIIVQLYTLLDAEIGRFSHPWMNDAEPDVVGAHFAVELIDFFNSIPDIKQGNFTTRLKDYAGLSEEDVDRRVHPNRKEAEGRNPQPLITDTFWQKLLNIRVGLTVPEKDRYEHGLIVGTTGAGKTQLMQQLIWNDLQSDAAVIVMTSKGSMLPTIAGLKNVRDRLIYFSPKHPLPINLFTLGSNENSVTLLNHIFEDIFDKSDAATVGHQIPLLNHSIRLLARTPGSNLWSLRDLMKAKKLPSDYDLSKLSKAGQDFFTDSFPTPDYVKTRAQLLWRLDLLLENPIIENVFCKDETAINMSEVFEGKVLLIDTGYDEAGPFGSSFIGRFFLAYIGIAAMQRKNLTRPVYVYVDEVGDYATPTVGTIMRQCREVKVGLTIACQELNLLKQAESGVMTNALTKMVGRCSEADARKLASALRVEHDKLQHQEKLHFHLTWPSRNRRAVPIQADLLLLERQEKHPVPYKPTLPQQEIISLNKPEKSTPEKGTGWTKEW